MAKKKVVDQEEEVVAEGGVRVYELGFHLMPELSAEEVKDAYQAIRAEITKSAEIITEGGPEKVPLAYTISRNETTGRRDFDAAYLCWVAYEASVEVHEALIKAAGTNPHIIRFIDIVTDKDTARAASERIALTAKSEDRAEPGLETTLTEDVSLDAALESATL